MSVETIINKLAGGMVIKVSHQQSLKENVRFKTESQRFSRVDIYEFIQESADGRQVKSVIPERLYLALLDFEKEKPMNYKFTIFFDDDNMSVEMTTQYTHDPDYHASELKRIHEKSGEKVIRVTFKEIA